MTSCQAQRSSRITRRAFSLLELLAVVTILGIIAVVVIPRITVSKTKSMRNVALHGQREIRAAAERYYLEKGGYPGDGNAFLHDTQFCDPGLTDNNYNDWVNAGYWYTYNATTGVFTITQNGQPIK